MPIERPRAISKELSRNDTGETGGHQAGILVPREPRILAFFPIVDPGQYNPRHMIVFHDSFGGSWTFSFIYYNNSHFGGTRDEYRLTRMTPYIRSHNLLAGDTLTLSRDENGRYAIDFVRQHPVPDTPRLKLGDAWKVITI
jgi:hypothetical protein